MASYQNLNNPGIQGDFAIRHRHLATSAIVRGTEVTDTPSLRLQYPPDADSSCAYGFEMHGEENDSVKPRLRIEIFCIFLVLVFAANGHTQASRTIFLIRHADKASDAPDAVLSNEGHRRAECLAKMLSDADIEQIYVSDLQRTQQTAAPLAQQRHLEPVAIPLSKPDELIEAIKSGEAANVLVVWHGGTIPRVLHELGAPEVPAIADAEYDRFYILTLSGNKEHSMLGFTVLRYCDGSE